MFLLPWNRPYLAHCQSGWSCYHRPHPARPLIRVCSVLPSNSRISESPLWTTFRLPLHPPTMSSMLSLVGIHLSAPCHSCSTRPGFSFSGEVRDPFPAVIQAMQDAQVPVTSVDAPSSWNIEEGPPKSGVGSAFNPDVLVSLTAPKPLVKYFKGRHFIGGRYVPYSVCPVSSHPHPLDALCSAPPSRPPLPLSSSL